MPVVSLLVDIIVAECQSEIQLNSNRYVSSVAVSGSQLSTNDINDLFEFDDTDTTYCAPSNMKPFTMTISYSSPVLLTEIGIHGYDGLFNNNDFVTRFSLSFSEDGNNFTEYIRDTGSTVSYITIHMHVAILLLSCRSSLCQVMRGVTLDYGLPSLPLV